MDLDRHPATFPSDEAVAMDEPAAGANVTPRRIGRSPLTKARSFSDGGLTPSKLTPSPRILEASRRTSKDDSNLRDLQPPVTPRRSDLGDFRGLSLQMSSRQSTPPPASSRAYVKPAPLSPKLDHSHIYASPTNILPRRSRGLDFSRAATSLHHSTLAEQSSPESSPTIGDRAMNIPRRSGDYGGPEQTSTSLWSVMGNHDKMNVSNSLGSTLAVASDSSTTSDDGDAMDEDMEEVYVTTPQISRTGNPGPTGGPFGSPAMSSLMSFQQRQRPRRQPKKKMRGPLGLGFNIATAALSRSPPNNSTSTTRRESISWQANQLHISGAEVEESSRSLSDADGGSGDGQRNVIRRVVTRRGNLLPKTKTFARIRAALAEEGAPAEAECKREAEVVKQVRESEPDLDVRSQAAGQEPVAPAAPSTAKSSPNMANQDSLDDIPEDDMMGELTAGLSSSFKQHAIKNSKGKTFWDTFSESSSVGGARTTPPPPLFPPRSSSSGISEDAAMDSPSLNGHPYFATGASHSRAESQRSDAVPYSQSNSGQPPPTAAEITRRINNKRRREDDFDPNIFKRRAVSPGMSAHNSPMPQSPLQRDSNWGSRPGSTGGEKGGSSAPSESGSMGGGTSGSATGNAASGSNGRVNSKVRVGFQGMVDTNDGIMRMSIE